MDLKEKLRPWFTPMHTSPPTPQDETCSKALEEYLDENAPLETDVEESKRVEVLINLGKITSEWVKWVSTTKRGVPEEDAKPGKLFLSGSYRMGVAQKGADIDTVLVVPMYVQREDFFSEEEGGLIERLKSDPLTSHLLPISTAAVPLIELVMGGIELDVLFACLQQADVPTHPDQLLDDSLLLKCDQPSVLSLNGPRVTELLVKLVPKFNTFRLVLRTLRLWAKKRGIYSNKLGFLGGVNFAILAAFACQLWPNETSSRCLARLLILVTQWKWPSPIRLCHPYDVENAMGSDHLKQWDNTRNRDKMPIITPAFPNFNSSASVTSSTLKTMLREFQRGREEVRIILNKGHSCNKEDWALLFQETDFFYRFPIYVSIVARSENENGLKKWAGFVESRIRKFVEFLENQRLPFYEIFPYQNSFDVLPIEDSQEVELRHPGKRWFVGLRVDTILARTRNLHQINLEGAVVSFSQLVLDHVIRDEGTTVDLTILKFKDVVRLFPEFFKGGERDAFRKNKEIHDLTQKEIEKSRTSIEKKPVQATGEEEEEEEGNEIEENGENKDNSGGVLGGGEDEADKTQLLLSMNRNRRDNIDLTELPLIPSKVYVRTLVPTSVRPLPFKVTTLN